MKILRAIFYDEKFVFSDSEYLKDKIKQNFVMKILRKLHQKFRNIEKRFSNTYYLSIGENCLTDNILERHNLKCFSTPYSHARSNLDYAIELEKDNYKNLLNPKYLYYDFLGKTKVVRNSYYSKSKDIYDKIHQNGFEFTHHDVLNSLIDKNSYDRKVMRMLTLNKNKKLKFLYHYRNNSKKDLKQIVNKAKIFLDCYCQKGFKCEFIFFTQSIVHNFEERSFSKTYDSHFIKGYTFYTVENWAGLDDNVLWAKNDEDLISKMIKEIK